MSKIKIAHVCPKYFPSIGGIETHVKAISERLVKTGFNVDVLTTDREGNLPVEETINGVRVKRFKSFAPNEAYWLSNSLKLYLRRHSCSYDIIHAHSYHALPALYCMQSKNSAKFFFTPHYHGAGHTFFRQVLHIPYKFLGKKIFENADQIISVSKYEAELIEKNFKNHAKIEIIPNGIDFADYSRVSSMRNKIPTILYVGRLEHYKGVDLLIKSLPYVDSKVVLEIVGKGPYYENLLRLVERLGVENRVRFFSDLEKQALLQKYASSSLFVLLSKHESFGLTVAEALAAGTPCIVANTSALRQWVDDKNCFGLEFPIDLSNLSALIPKVMGKTVNKQSLPDWDISTRQLVNLYQITLGKKINRIGSLAGGN